MPPPPPSEQGRPQGVGPHQCIRQGPITTMQWAQHTIRLKGPRNWRETHRSDCWVFPGTPLPSGRLTPFPAGTRRGQCYHRVMGCGGPPTAA